MNEYNLRKRNSRINKKSESWWSKFNTQNTVSIIALLIAFAGLIASNVSTNRQLEISEKQYHLSNNMFKNNLKDLKSRNISDSIKYTQDTTEMRKQFRIQNDINSAQLDINKEQLTTFRLQAKISKDQSIIQKLAAKEAIFQTRPVLHITKIEFDSLTNYLFFYYQNLGVRAAVIKGIKLCFFNPRLLIFRKIELNERGDLQIGMIKYVNIGSNSSIINDKNTLYYIEINYSEDTQSKLKDFIRYFRIENNGNFQATISKEDEKNLRHYGFLNDFICKDVN